MSWLLFALSSGSAGAALWWALKLRERKNQIQRKYAPIVDIENHIKREKERIQQLERDEMQKIEEERKISRQKIEEERLSSMQRLEEDKLEVERKISKRDEELSLLEQETQRALKSRDEILGNLEQDHQRLKDDCDRLKEESEILENQIKYFHESEASLLSELGYYERAYDFEEFEKYKNELDKIREKKKELLKLDIDDIGSAVYRKGNWNLNLPAAQAKSFQKKVGRLMMRAFNGECDGFVARVNYKNIKLMTSRIKNSHAVINKTVYQQFMTKISVAYRDLWIRELRLAFEFEEWKQREKEEQARIREQIREEERAARELEKAKREAELEAQRNAEALTKARAEVDGANEQQKAKLLAQIQELELRMKEMEEKNRYISQAMLTKSGHVYIISNIGSFGESMLKIGMTRRLEPMDRVKELGDASVPFPFDVHAMIRTSDAPSLENALHKHFEERRVNLENNRKEFFYVTLNEIQEELDVLKSELNIEADIQLTMAAEAKQWRLSKAKREHLERSYES